MILYYSAKFHFIIINSFRVIGRGHFPPPLSPPPQKKATHKKPWRNRVKHNRILLSSSSSDLVRVPLLRPFKSLTSTVYSQLWNLIVKETPRTSIISTLSFKRFLYSKYTMQCHSTFDVNYTRPFRQCK